MPEPGRVRTPDDEVDDQMEAAFAAWLAKRPSRPAPAPPARITRPVVDDRMLTVAQAAREVGRSKRCVWQWAADGLLDTRRDVRGVLRIRAGSLWLDETVRAEP